MTDYDLIGQTYRHTRAPDRRIAAMIERELGLSRSVANIGAGTGSYEPAQTAVAVDPSRVMVSQRQPCAAPAVQGAAEQLPIRTKSVDAALAVFTVHHWNSVTEGVSELCRIARQRVVILTWDHRIFREFWLFREYLPAAAETDARLAVSLDVLTGLLPGLVSVRQVLVPHDCVDGFTGAFWRRPHAYLDETVRNGMSVLALTPGRHMREGLALLGKDLASGTWARRHADLVQLQELDLGYRLVTAQLPGSRA